jgi:hypothetical protein
MTEVTQMHRNGRSGHQSEPGTGPSPDELDSLIDRVLAQPRTEDVEAGDEVVAALRHVRAMAAEPPPPDSRARHLATIRTVDPVPSPARRSSPGWGLRLRRALAPVTAMAAALVVFAGGGSVALAQSADPDDALYPVKRSTEQVWLALPRSSEGAAEAHLALADRRIGEAQRAPHHADALIAVGMSNVEAAADERPEDALATFARLLGTGEHALPATASPRARTALYRNCVRIAAKHGLNHTCPEPADLGEQPGRGAGAGPADGPRGWGPGGRPEGHVGPPPWVPAHERGSPGEDG